MKSGSRTGSGSAAPSTTSAFVAIGVAVLVAEKRPSADEGASLRKRSRKAAPEQPTDASESTTKAPAKKRREPVETVERLRAELASYESRRKGLEQEVDILRYNLDGALDDRARPEGDAEGPKAVTAYKASRGFESVLEKMGRVSYEFGYRVVLEQLHGKHPEIEVEQDRFTECPKDDNVRMDLSQPFDDSTPSEK
ncbi:hypothetical protein GW17_00000951 [Ensete ventricosum]|nr:hypothetical protein GW17_00000951 [Ensete ventricosum]